MPTQKFLEISEPSALDGSKLPEEFMSGDNVDANEQVISALGAKNIQDQASDQGSYRRARVCIRERSDVPMVWLSLVCSRNFICVYISGFRFIYIYIHMYVFMTPKHRFKEFIDSF